MMSGAAINQLGQAGMGWVCRLAESLMEQLSYHQPFMDIDVIPGVWMSRSNSIRQYWEGKPKTSSR